MQIIQDVTEIASNIRSCRDFHECSILWDHPSLGLDVVFFLHSRELEHLSQAHISRLRSAVCEEAQKHLKQGSDL